MGDLPPEPVRAFSAFSPSQTVNSSLTAILKKTVEDESKKHPTPKDYIIVTDLVNPTAKLRDIICPNIPISPETSRRLKTGSKLHSFAAPWFREISGYTEEEGILDGAFVGLPGIRGKLDSFVNNSIIEFKTKDEKVGETLPNDAAELVANFPQDLEQVVFYALLHPDRPKQNYLVFMKSDPPQNLKVFRVTIKDFEAVKHLLLERQKSFNDAKEKRNDAGLGRCRYYGKGCHFQSAKACVCDSLKPYDMSGLLRHVTIEEDLPFAAKVEAARKAVKDRQKDIVYPTSILYPRNYFDRVKGVERTKSSNPEKDWHFESCLWHCVRKMGFGIDDADKSTLICSDERVRCKYNWLKIPMSGKSDAIVVPYINKVSNYSTPQQKPTQFAIAELAITCALHNKNRGVVFVMYPMMNKLVTAYDVKFDDLAGIKKQVDARLKQLEAAIAANDPSSLPELPSFMR